MSTRRDFIKKTILISATVPLVQNELYAMASPSKKTGIALYTIRDAMKQDPYAAMEEAAAIGYDWAEAADHNNGLFYGLKPTEFARLAKKAGLELISTHSPVRPENLNQMVDSAARAGFKYLILPSLPGEWNDTLDGFKKASDFFNKAGEKCRKAGITFGFHNHQVEFREIDGKIPYDILLKKTDEKLVVFEMDLAWITAAGKDPLDYFKKYPGRFALWHFKDLSQEMHDATLGEGIIDFKPIISKYKQSGMIYWFLEQDNCRTHTPMESIRISRDYFLNNLR